MIMINWFLQSKGYSASTVCYAYFRLVFNSIIRWLFILQFALDITEFNLKIKKLFILFIYLKKNLN